MTSLTSFPDTDKQTSLPDSSLLDRIYSKVKTGLQRGLASPTSPSTPLSPKNAREERNHLEPVLAPVTVSSIDPLNPPPHTPSQPIFSKVIQHLPGFALEREPSSESECQSIDHTATVLHILDRLKTGHLGKEYWMKNENCHACFLCDASFSAWRRKHHCRICGNPPIHVYLNSGQIFCFKCTAMVTGTRCRIGSALRVCKTCLEIMDQYQDDELVQPQPVTQVSYSYDSNPLLPDPVSTPMMAIPATRLAGDTKTNSQLEFPPIHDQRPPSSKSRSRRQWAFANDDFLNALPFRRSTIDEEGNFPHPHSIIDPELAPYMSDEESHDDPSVSLFSTLLTKPPDTLSVDSCRKRRNNSRLRIAPSDLRSNTASAPSNSRRNTINTARPTRARSLVHRLSASLHSLDTLKASAPQVSPELNAASLQHLRRLLNQLLLEISTDLAWQDAIMPILLKISHTVRPDVKNGDDLDIRHYVKIKRIPGATPKDTRYINGIVFTKNVALKRMARSIDNPRIAIIAFPIEYHREEPKLMSLEPVIAQEHEYLRNLVNRIIALRPNVVLVQGSVSGIALKFLDEAKITVAINVKMTVLQAVARLTQAHIITSIDRLAFGPKVGKCAKVSVKTCTHSFHKKSFMWIEGCREELGCTVILRGAPMDFLTNVKRVLDFMVFAVNNLKLETALFRDQFALLPEIEAAPLSENSETAKFETILSVSPVVKFPLPYLLQSLLESTREANNLKETGFNQSLEVLHQTAKDPVDSYIPKSLDHQWKEILETTIRNALRTAVFKKSMQKLLERERQWSSFLAQTPDIASPLVHQNLVVLFSTVCSVTAVPCQGPEIHAIEYYRESDCTLGQYVQDMSFESHAICTANGCDKRSFEHYRCYVHGDARISVVLENVPSPLPGMHETILMWSYCKKCKQNLPVTAMPDNTWKYSFGKFLELFFYDNGLKTRAGMCPHHINRDHLRYFGYQNWAVRFEYDAIQLFGVSVPNLKLEWKLQSLLVSKFEEYNLLEGRISRFFDSVEKRCKSIRTDNIPPDKIEPCKSEILRLQKLSFEDRQLLHAQLRETFVNSGIRDSLSLSKAFRGLQEHVIKWDRYFVDLDDRFFLSEKDIRYLTAMQFRKLFADKDPSPSFEESETTESELDRPIDDEPSSVDVPIIPEELEGKKLKKPENSRKVTPRPTDLEILRKPPKVKDQLRQKRDSLDALPPPKSRFPRAKPPSSSKVSTLTKHFNNLSKEFEQQKARERKVLRASIPRSLPVAPSKPMIQVFSNPKDEHEHWDDEDEVEEEPEKSPQQVDEQIEGEPFDLVQTTECPPDPTGHISDSELAGPGLEKSSFMKTLTNFLADRSAATWSPLEPALAPSEHLFADSDVVVREDEPSSLIAFTLASPAYVFQISNMRASHPQPESGMHQLESVLLKETEVQDGESRMVCKVFYAEQFEALRQQCGCSETFIQSLARCRKWDSSGGKSGSAFLKTNDNRFVLKGTTRLEIESFMKFAPSYFEFMAQAFFHELPTALAKIMGFYQIHTRSSSTGKTVKMNIMVTENLFYDRKISRIFDLKGSMRNRHVESTGKEDEVLLDENLVEFIYESPLFIREHSKRLLRASLWNDTLFLAKINVMDYSLVIGIDDEQHELVVDYIRTYTWDKKLESWVKERGFVGRGSKEPTVVTPRLYKNRFRESMSQYLLLSPDCWHILSFNENS